MICSSSPQRCNWIFLGGGIQTPKACPCKSDILSIFLRRVEETFSSVFVQSTSIYSHLVHTHHSRCHNILLQPLPVFLAYQKVPFLFKHPYLPPKCVCRYISKIPVHLLAWQKFLMHFVVAWDGAWYMNYVWRQAPCYCIPPGYIMRP